MKLRPLFTLVFAVVAAVLASVAGPDPAYAAKKTFENKKLGFRLKIDDSYTQSPPKLTTDSAFIVGDWYEDAAKYDDGNLKPTFRMFWFVTPREKPATTPEAPEAAPKYDPDDPEAFMRAMRDQMKSHSVDEYLDDYFQWNTHLYGDAVLMKDRWANASKDQTAGKVPFQWVEVNAPAKKKDKKALPHGYAFIAKLTLERPNETIEVGFMGSCPVVHLKDFQKSFPASVRSFEELKSGATDSRNEGANQELSQDRETRYKQIVEQKLVKGWKSDRTQNYILIYHEDVDQKLAKAIGVQVEAIRSQIYEVLFPADKPVTAFSIIRVCKDREQYMGYGAPGGSAGYWDSNSEELVFYEAEPKKDSLRVLYHEAFHQYIFYSVGDFAPHSWFNEGHGDYFAGHNYVAGHFARDVFQWRISDAKTWKRLPNRPRLKDWVTWSQSDYYGGNKEKIDGGLNYAAGWSLVYFLRTTKKPEYQGVLERYFNSLKGSVTRARLAAEAARAKNKEWDAKIKEWEDKVKEDPSLPRPVRPVGDDSGTSDIGSRETWLTTALTEAYKGIDWDAIEKDWLAADY